VGGGRLNVRRVVVALAVVGVAAFGAAQALGASESITAVAGPQFGKASFSIDRGTTAIFDNQDLSATTHDVTAFDTGGAKNLPLFRSAEISGGQTTPVSGTASLGAGTYRFFCTVHPTQMTGQLVVTPSTSPTVAVTVLSRKLGPVAKSGKLKVKVSGLLATNAVPLTARVGKKKLGSTSVTDLGAGASRTVKVPLSRSGKNFLSRRGSAKLKVTASPPGDQPVTVARRLG
jgi:plastocyanin